MFLRLFLFIRIVCMFGAVLASLSIFASSFSPSIGLFRLTYSVLGGFGCGMVFVSATLAVPYYFERRRALALGK